MCVIIHKPQGVEISQDIFERCWESNADGAGMMYFDPKAGKLVAIKGLMTLESFTHAYGQIKDSVGDIAIHFRYASAGMISPEQTHPFFVNDNLAFVHNGHLSNLVNPENINTEDREKSDTIIFNETILRKLPKNFIFNSGIIRLLEYFLGGSVVVFMDNKGHTKIVGNITNSIVVNGVWFSNDFWMDDFASEESTEEEFASYEKGFSETKNHLDNFTEL